MGSKYLISGGYVATMDDKIGDVQNGAVLVEDGIIKAVGRAQSDWDSGLVFQRSRCRSRDGGRSIAQARLPAR